MNECHGLVKMYLLNNTELTEQEHNNKFHQENIVQAVLEVTLSDGSVRRITVPEIVSLEWTLYQDNNFTHEKVTKP